MYTFAGSGPWPDSAQYQQPPGERRGQWTGRSGKGRGKPAEHSEGGDFDGAGETGVSVLLVMPGEAQWATKLTLDHKPPPTTPPNKCFWPKLIVVFKFLDPQNIHLGFVFVSISAIVVKFFTRNWTSMVAFWIWLYLIIISPFDGTMRVVYHNSLYSWTLIVSEITSQNIKT